MESTRLSWSKDRRCEMRPVLRLVGALGAVGVVGALAQRLRRESRAKEQPQMRVPPDPRVDDRTLADRVRSTLGPLEKRLDLPHLHVMVEDHIVLLHGEVATDEDVQLLEDAARRVSGVQGVESYLHVGLLPGDTRPSQGRSVSRPSSEAKRRLLSAATSAGADEAHAAEAVRATFAVLAERLPSEVHQRLLAHLPEDVRAILTPPRRAGAIAARVRTVPELVAAVLWEEDGAIAAERVPAVVAAVLSALHELAPEEGAYVAAVLPPDLRDLWGAPVRESERP
jgi:uncharacterized protein (DUF2267 family)